ncbi:TPA: hypothetical protein K8F70_002431 [Listeria monocytogenes]|nr:hypothetical protein [Listeria monocytogenes]
MRHLIENEESDNIKGDIFVRCRDIVLAVECKAKDFKDVFRNKNQAVNRLNRHFNKIIKHVCKQCDRVKKNIVSNKSVIYYDSKDMKSRKKIIDISDTSKIKVLKVLVTLDDYLNLSESPHEFLEIEYKTHG